MPPPIRLTARPSSSGEAGTPPSNNLWIGNLSPEVSDSDLTALIERFGPIDSITNYSARSYAFVYFKKIEDAKACKEKLQGTILHGNPIRIEFAKPAKPCKSLWVAGISQSVSKEALEEEFMKFGKIQEFKFLRDRSTAFVDYVRLEDAYQALKNMNGKHIGGDQIRVDFLRSQPSRRDQVPDFRDARDGHFPNRSIGPPDARWMPPDSLKTYSEPAHTGSKRHQFLSSGGQKIQVQPSKVLWINYPPSVQIDEDMLHNAMILFGEIERIKTFEDRNYAFVQFRSVDEARLAKEGLQGKLFSDPRISIEYSNSELAANKDYIGSNPLNEIPLRQGPIDLFGANCPILAPRGVLGPDVLLRPLGPQGSFEPIFQNSEIGDLASLNKLQDGGHHSLLGGPNWKRSSPAPGFISSPSATLNPRSVSGAWDIFDASQLQREPKRLRVDGTLSPFDAPFPPKRVDDRGLGFDDPLANFEGRNRVSPVDGRFSASGLGQRHPDHDYVWRGVIAKGGTPICRARCVPIGEGIGFEIPDVVNCSARTGLDMLTKHYADAVGFSIVFFLPDREADFASYTEFLRYLGAKSRAGVAKFEDGTTLFLVPPSDFLTKVLNVAGPERLYGVVLQFPQAAPSSTAQPQFGDIQLQTTTQTGYNVMPREESALQIDYNRTAHEGVKPSLKALGPSSSGVIPTNSAAGAQSGVTLTPELIATLASLLPGNKPSGLENSSVQSISASLGPALNSFPAPDKGLGQVWTHDRQFPGQTGHLEQQLSSQIQSQAQFVPQVQPYLPVSNTPSHSAHGVIGYSQMQDRALNLQLQGALSSRPITSTIPSQGQAAVSLHVDQHHQLGVPQDSLKGHGMTHGYGSTVLQQPTYPVAFANEVNGGNVLQMHDPMMLASEMNLINQVYQPQSAMHGGHQTSETEDEKNRRYQTTLLFAADLLSKVQQPPGNQSGQSSGSH